MGSRPSTSSKEIKFEALLQGIEDNNVTVIDVRNRDELQETGKLPGSFCVPLGEVTNAFSKMSEDEFMAKYGYPRPLPDAGESLVITCRSGRRVGLAVEELEKLGYKGLSAYKGSFLDWKANKGPLERF